MTKKKNKYYPKAFAGGIIKTVLGAGQLLAGSAADKREGADLDKAEIYKVPNMFKKLQDDAVDDTFVQQKIETEAASRAQSLDVVKQASSNQAMSMALAQDRVAKKGAMDMLAFENAAQTRADEALAGQESIAEQSKNQQATQRKAEISAQISGGWQNIMSAGEDVDSMILGAMTGGFAEKGAKITAEDGGVTPDEFDHDTNPIDLVQDGEKIGEATGGELILPPDDVKAIEASIEAGDKDAAFELLKELVAKYNSNPMEAEAASGGKVPMKGKKEKYKPSRLKY